MAECVANPSCRFCDLSADPANTHCTSCGGRLSHDENHHDSNEILLVLATQIHALVASKTRGLFGAHRELKMSIATGALCTLWMFSCLIVVNLPSFGSATIHDDATVAVQTPVQHGDDVLEEPTLQAAIEDR